MVDWAAPAAFSISFIIAMIFKILLITSHYDLLWDNEIYCKVFVKPCSIFMTNYCIVLNKLDLYHVFYLKLLIGFETYHLTWYVSRLSKQNLNFMFPISDSGDIPSDYGFIAFVIWSFSDLDLDNSLINDRCVHDLLWVPDSESSLAVHVPHLSTEFNCIFFLWNKYICLILCLILRFLYGLWWCRIVNLYIKGISRRFPSTVWVVVI